MKKVFFRVGVWYKRKRYAVEKGRSGCLQTKWKILRKRKRNQNEKIDKAVLVRDDGYGVGDRML